MSIKEIPSHLYNYLNHSPKSLEFMKAAKEIMPNGVTANIKFYSPYPLVMNQGKGAYLTDVDGNEYIDYLLAYGSLMLGHGHPKIKEAILQQLANDGTCLFGTPHHLELEMGKRIKALYPSIELLRYTNSGTEATLLALRLACAYTGKHKIAKFEGHYHGGYDQVLYSINPSAEDYGPEANPHPVPESKGMDPYFEKNTIILPFNHLDHTAEILQKHKDEIAAVIMEPFQAGFIAATPTFMEGLRKLTSELGIVLIFDEVKTGFRIQLGGAQSYYNIKPDLTALGKVIGGGYPFGIVGGKKEILTESAPSLSADVFDPSQSLASTAQEILFHSGTYNGHPMILAAGMAVLDVLEKEFAQVVAHTTTLKKGLEEIFARKGIPMKAIGTGTIFNVILTDEEKIQNYRDLQKTNVKVRKELDYYLLTEGGIYTKPLNRYSLSTCHGQKEIAKTLEAYEMSLTKWRNETKK